MKFKLIYVLLFVLSIGLVEGKTPSNLLDKVIIHNLNDCYNLTVQYDLIEGNSTPVYFSGCSDKGNQTWFCDCKNIKFYNLTMQTDKSMLREPREYEFNIEANLYDVCSDSDSFEVKDWGDYIDEDSVKLKCSSTKKSSDRVEIIYINKTVEVPVIEYRDVVKETVKEVYVENQTRINELALRLDNSHNEINRLSSLLDNEINRKQIYFWLMFLACLSLVAIVMVCLYLKRR